MGFEHTGVMQCTSDPPRFEVITDFGVELNETLLAPQNIVRAGQAEDKFQEAIPTVHDSDAIARLAPKRVETDDGLVFGVQLEVASSANKRGKPVNMAKSAQISKARRLTEMPPPLVAKLPEREVADSSRSSRSGDIEVRRPVCPCTWEYAQESFSQKWSCSLHPLAPFGKRERERHGHEDAGLDRYTFWNVRRWTAWA